jgi:hypothetical protein
VEKVLRVMAEENSSPRKLPHLDAPKTAGGITRAKDFIEARIERRGAVLLQVPIGSREERRGHGHAHKRNHENGEKPCKVLSNPNLRSARIAVNSRQSTVKVGKKESMVDSLQLTAETCKNNFSLDCARGIQ